MSRLSQYKCFKCFLIFRTNQKTITKIFYSTEMQNFRHICTYVSPLFVFFGIFLHFLWDLFFTLWHIFWYFCHSLVLFWAFSAFFFALLGNTKIHTSHLQVMCHMSDGTFHVSLVTCHRSPVTFHLSLKQQPQQQNLPLLNPPLCTLYKNAKQLIKTKYCINCGWLQSKKCVFINMWKNPKLPLFFFQKGRIRIGSHLRHPVCFAIKLGKAFTVCTKTTTKWYT